MIYFFVAAGSFIAGLEVATRLIHRDARSKAEVQREIRRRKAGS